MKRNKKERIGLGDLWRLPTTPVAIRTTGYEDSKTLFKRLQDEEKSQAEAAKQAAYLASPAGQLAQAAAPINAELKACWSRPLGTFTRDEAVPDSPALGGYTTRETGIADKLMDFSEEHDASYTEFCKELERRGIEFKSADAVRKLAAFMVTNVYLGGIAYTSDNWMRSFERLFYLDVITANDVTGYTGWTAKPAELAEPQAPSKTPQQLVDEQIEGMDTSTKAGQRAMLELLDPFDNREAQEMYLQFADFMKLTYGVNVLSKRIATFAAEWAVKWNKNLADPRHLNELRRALDYQQLLGPRGHLLTADERLSRSLEDTTLTNVPFETRQDIVSRLKSLAEK